MSSTTLYRLSGLALLPGALLFLIGQVLSAVPQADASLPTQQTNALYLTLTLLSFLGMALLVLGLPGIVARQAVRAGWLGWVGFLLVFLSGLLYLSDTVIGFLVISWLSVNAPHVMIQWFSDNAAYFVYEAVESLLLAAGGVLLGTATMRAKVLPRWAGLFLMVAVILDLVGFALPDMLSTIVTSVASVLLALAFGWFGYALWLTKGATL